MELNGLSSLFAPSAPRGPLGLQPRETASTFAADIVRRAGVDTVASTPPENGAAPSVDAADKNTAAKNLEKALASTVDFMADRFGDTAASVMTALIYKGIGDGPVTEENLGQALLDVAKFVDANFGYSEGDAFINHINGSLNDSLNAFFDNGSNEEFLAVTMSGSGATVNGTDMGDSLIGSLVDSVNSLLEQYAALRKKPPKVASPYGDLLEPLAAKGLLLNEAA